MYLFSHFIKGFDGTLHARQRGKRSGYLNPTEIEQPELGDGRRGGLGGAKNLLPRIERWFGSWYGI